MGKAIIAPVRVP